MIHRSFTLSNAPTGLHNHRLGQRPRCSTHLRRDLWTSGQAGGLPAISRWLRELARHRVMRKHDSGAGERASPPDRNRRAHHPGGMTAPPHRWHPSGMKLPSEQLGRCPRLYLYRPFGTEIRPPPNRSTRSSARTTYAVPGPTNRHKEQQRERLPGRIRPTMPSHCRGRPGSGILRSLR